MKYSEDQIEALRKYYPNSNYGQLSPFFPGLTKRQIGVIARNHGIKSNNPGHRKNLIGKRFYNLTVISLDHLDENHRVYWKCKCDCGNEVSVLATLLNNGGVKSCGCRKSKATIETFSKDYTGQKFGKLTAIKRFPKYKSNRTYYLCQCDCGSEPKMVSSSNLVRKHTQTCGKCEQGRTKSFWNEKNTESKDKRLYLVYMHTTPNGKKYIGITQQNTTRRWQNGHGYDTQTLFHRAIKKYGWENIKHEILEENLSEREAWEREKYYIQLYKTTNPKYGYNIHSGGTSGKLLVKPVYQYHNGKLVNFFESVVFASEELGVSDSTVQNYCKRKDLPDNYSFVMSKAIHVYDIDEELYSFRDKSHYRIVDLIKQESKEKTISRNIKTAKKINQYDLNGIFIKTWDSIKEAEEILNIQNLSSVYSNNSTYKSAGNYQWRYYSGNTDNIEPLAKSSCNREVLQLDAETFEIVGEYDSMAEAERRTGVSSKQIYKSCQRTHIKAGNYVWRYKDDTDALIPVFPKKPKYKTIPVCQYSLDGKYLRSFNSIAEAEKAYPSANIYSVVSPNVSASKSSGGYMWKYDTGNHDDIKPYHANGRRVQQIDFNTGEVLNTFSSAREAQRVTKIQAANINKVCSGERPKAGGFFWKYAD